VLPLEHKYTQASLKEFGFACLKGVDRARYSALESVGELDLILAIACEAHTRDYREDDLGKIKRSMKKKSP